MLGANDVEDGHYDYDGAIASLESLESKTREIVPKSEATSLAVSVCSHTVSSLD